MGAQITSTDNGFIDINISVELKSGTTTRSLSEDLKVDQLNIDEYLVKSPAITAYWHALYESQRTKSQRAKIDLDRKFAELDLKYRSIYINDKPPTDKAVEAKIRMDADYQKLEDALVAEQEVQNILKSAVEALHELRSVLISLAANKRVEFSPSRIGKQIEQMQEQHDELSKKLRDALKK